MSLSIKELDAFYGESIILNGVDIKVEKGEVTGLIGRNGVGKTTLLKSIMGLVNTPRGSVDIDGKDYIKKNTFERVKGGIAYVPQGRDIFPQMTIEENLLLGLEANKRLKKEGIPEEIYELFPVLKDMLSRKGGDLSGGQQQQLAIARALVSKPQWLILDEPTEGIQPSIIQDIGRVLKKLKAEGNMGILLVEQYLDFVVDISDSYYVMEKGTVVVNGRTDEMDKEYILQTLAV